MGIEERLLKQFDVYAHGFDFSDEHITRKYFHSIRVMERAREIAVSERLSDRMIDMALVAGLLHDYSRFEQWRAYHTFKDAKSVDHADAAARLLFEEGEIEKFYGEKQHYGVIRDSIRYHNKYALPEDLGGDNLALAKLVRDADKLDIIEIFTWNKHLLAETEEEVSPAVEQCFFADKMVNSHDAQNGNDWIVLSLAMIYDLNYAYSFRYIAEKNLLEKIFENLDYKDKFQKYFEYIKNFVDRKNR